LTAAPAPPSRAPGEHPFFFTWTAQETAAPLRIVGGEGPFIHLEDGDRLLDLGSLIYQANLGHGHRPIVDAVKAQADRLCLSLPGAVYPEKTELAERLLALAPPPFQEGKVFFTLGGSDANENALKIARLVTGRSKALARYRSYHGATFGAVSLTGDWRRPAVEPGLPGIVHVDELSCPACPGGLRGRGCDHPPITRIPQALDLEGPGTVAAVFLESVVGGNGVLIPPAAGLAAIREACDAHGTLLVLDEVLTGFGRTGRNFALEHLGVTPDLITLGKGLTAGYGVLGAVLVHPRVAEVFDRRVLPAGLTFYAHPLGVAAALAALDAYRREDANARAAAMEGPLGQRLASWAAAHPHIVRGWRGIGALCALDLELPPAGFQLLARELRAAGVHAHVQPRAGVLILAPPLTIRPEVLGEGLDRVGTVLDALAVDR
jgi:taurine--2-oxoglutarate transaminase